MQSPEVTQTASLDREVAEGVYRFGSDRFNWYVLEAEDGLTMFDAGLPAHEQQLFDWLDDNDYDLDDVAAVVLTHADPDHVGFASTLTDRGIPVYCHPDDFQFLRNHPLPEGRDAGWLLRNLWRPGHVLFVYEMFRDGAASVEPIDDAEPLTDGDVLDVPGKPRVIHTPGHTPGSCSFYVEERDVLFSGDELVTWNALDGREGPQEVSFAHEDPGEGRRSLARLQGLGSVVLLPGHGDPWRGDIDEAIDLAR